MLTVQRVDRTTGQVKQLPIPIEASINLKTGLDYDSATTIWSGLGHTQLTELFNNLNRNTYAFNLRHEEVENSYGHWYPITSETSVKAGGHIVSVLWRRWEELSALEASLPNKIGARLRAEVQATDVLAFIFSGFTTLVSKSPYFYWNLVLASGPPYNHYTGKDPIIPLYTPYPALIIGDTQDVQINRSVRFLIYIIFALGLINEIQSDIFKDEDQNFSDVLKELREYQLSIAFSSTDWTLAAPITPESSYDVLPTLPSAGRPRHLLTRQLLANELKYTTPLDDKYTRPIACAYTPTNNYTGDDISLGTEEQPSNAYEYIDRPSGPDDSRVPLRVKHSQTSREKAILECHLQRYKILEEYNRASFAIALEHDWRPLDSFIIPSELYHTENDVLGVILSVTHAYPRTGPRLSNITAKLFPKVN